MPLRLVICPPRRRRRRSLPCICSKASPVFPQAPGKTRARTWDKPRIQTDDKRLCTRALVVGNMEIWSSVPLAVVVDLALLCQVSHCPHVGELVQFCPVWRSVHARWLPLARVEQADVPKRRL